MIKAIINGCNGRMGQVLTRIIAETDNMDVVAGIDMNEVSYGGFPVFKTPSDCDIDYDVMIDISHFSAVTA